MKYLLHKNTIWYVIYKLSFIPTQINSRLHDVTVRDTRYHYERYRQDSFLEVQVDGEWGLVCHAYQHRLQLTGQVVCREHRKQFYAGHRSGSATQYTGPRFYGTMDCSGDELSSENCKMNFLKVPTCGVVKETVIDCTLRELLQFMFLDCACWVYKHTLHYGYEMIPAHGSELNIPHMVVCAACRPP